MTAPAVIDRSFEATDRRLPANLARRRAWRGSHISAHDCLLRLDDEAITEIRNMRERMLASPLPRLLRRAEHFELSFLRANLQQARIRLGLQDSLDEEVRSFGVAIIDSLPMDDLDAEEATTIFFTVGQMIGRPVAQKWDGTMLYDVRDSGASFGYGVRGSTTNVELLFHNDNAFAICPPDVVGLMCLRPAREGGVSRFCSMYAIHEALREAHAQALERLYQPMLWDRQAEHAPGAAKVLRAPMFRVENEHLLTRNNAALVRKGYEVAGETMDASLNDALQALEAVNDDPSLWFELPIERGQLQYLNNVTTAHYRSNYRDHEDPALKRHLIRSWHRDRGRPDYDG